MRSAGSRKHSNGMAPESVGTLSLISGKPLRCHKPLKQLGLLSCRADRSSGYWYRERGLSSIAASSFPAMRTRPALGLVSPSKTLRRPLLPIARIDQSTSGGTLSAWASWLPLVVSGLAPLLHGNERLVALLMHTGLRLR